MGQRVTRLVSAEEAASLLGADLLATYRDGFRRCITRGNEIQPLTLTRFTLYIMSPLPQMPAPLVNRLFSAMDVRGDGELSQEDFLAGMAVLTRGDTRHKASLLFRVYAPGEDGTGVGTALQRSEVYKYISLVLYDNKMVTGADCDRALELMWSRARRPDWMSRDEWMAWASALTPTEWARHPLTGWLDYIAAALMPDREDAALRAAAAQWAAKEGGGMPTPGSNVGGDHAAAVARAVSMWASRIKHVSASGVMDGPALAAQLGPTVPHDLAVRIAHAMDTSGHGTLAPEHLTHLVSVFGSGGSSSGSGGVEEHVAALFRMFDGDGDGVLTDAELVALVESAWLWARIAKVSLPRPVAHAPHATMSPSGVRAVGVDTTRGSVDELVLASLRAQTRGRIKEMGASIVAEVRGTVHAAEGHGGGVTIPAPLTLDHVSVWARDHPELLSGVSLLTTAIAVEGGVPPPLPSQLDMLRRVCCPYAPDRPGRAGDAWYVVPAVWVWQWAVAASPSLASTMAVAVPAVAGDSGGGGGLSPRTTGGGVGPIPTTRLVRGTAPILGKPHALPLPCLRTGLNEAAWLIPALLSPPDRVAPTTPDGAWTLTEDDYVLLPPRAWAAVSAWHGTDGPPIQRMVTVNPTTARLDLELYPPIVTAYRLRREAMVAGGGGMGGKKPAAGSGGTASGGAGGAPLPKAPPVLEPMPNPKLPAGGDVPPGGGGRPSDATLATITHVYQVSRATTLAELTAMFAEPCFATPDRTRLWVGTWSSVAGVAAAGGTVSLSHAKSAAALWPFSPLFAMATPATVLDDLDQFVPDGCDLVVDVCALSDNQWASIATGWAGVYFAHNAGATPTAAGDTGAAATPGKGVGPAPTATPARKPGAAGPPTPASATPTLTTVPSHIYPGAIGPLPPPKPVTAGKGGAGGAVSGAGKGKGAGPGSDAPDAAPLQLVPRPPPRPGTPWTFARRPAALVGLTNLGNTCYLGSALQCLLHTPLLPPYFLTDEWMFDVNVHAKLGTGGLLLTAFADLVKEVYEAQAAYPGGVTAVAPRRFKHWLSVAAPQFSGNEQHDSQEALATVLAYLSEDANRVLDKPYVEQPDSNGRPDDVVADEWWVGHCKREQSIVSSLFTGQFKSLLTCDMCGHASARFETFNSLALPLPEPRIRHVTVTLMPPHPAMRPVVVTAALPPAATVRDLKRAVATHLRDALAASVARFLTSSATPPSPPPATAADGLATPPRPQACNPPLARGASITEGTGEDADHAAATSLTNGGLGGGSSGRGAGGGGDAGALVMATLRDRMLAFLASPLDVGGEGLEDSAITALRHALTAVFQVPDWTGMVTGGGASVTPAAMAALPSAAAAVAHVVKMLMAVPADALVMVRGSGNTLLTYVDDGPSYSGGGLRWDVDDNRLLSSFRDLDVGSLVMYCCWGDDACRIRQTRAVEAMASGSSRSGRAGDTPPWCRFGAPVWAPWKGGNVYPGYVYDVLTPPASSLTPPSDATLGSGASTGAPTSPLPYDSDDDRAQPAGVTITPAAGASEPAAGGTALDGGVPTVQVWFDDGDFDPAVPVTRLQYRLLAPLTLVMYHRTPVAPYFPTAIVPPALPGAAGGVNGAGVYPPGRAPPVMLPAGWGGAGATPTAGGVHGSAVAGAPGLASGAEVARGAVGGGGDVRLPQPVGLGAMGGLTAFASVPQIPYGASEGSTAPFFLSPLARVLFGAPLMVRLHPGITTTATLYAHVAWMSQRFIRKRMPLSQPRKDGGAPRPDDATPASTQATWGFVLRRVSHHNPLACSQCQWIKACPGCPVLPSGRTSLTRVGLKEGETLVVDWDPIFLLRHLDRVEVVARDVHASVITAAEGEAAPLRLEQCLDVFSREERLEEAGYCAGCSKVRTPGDPSSFDVIMRPQTKRLEVWRAPPILTVQLKRFQHTSARRGKLHNLVIFPVEHLSLKPYMARQPRPQPPVDLSMWQWLGGKLGDEAPIVKDGGGGGDGMAARTAPASQPHHRLRTVTGAIDAETGTVPTLLSRNNSDYVLYGVVSHYGALGAGHYVAFARSFVDDSWHTFNDRMVHPVTDIADIVSPAAYLLFYARKDIAAGWQAGLHAEDALMGRVVVPRPLPGAAPVPPSPTPLETWDVHPHRAGTRPLDVSSLRRSMLAAGVTAEALGFLDTLADKCAIM